MSTFIFCRQKRWKLLFCMWCLLHFYIQSPSYHFSLHSPPQTFCTNYKQLFKLLRFIFNDTACLCNNYNAPTALSSRTNSHKRFLPLQTFRLFKIIVSSSIFSEVSVIKRNVQLKKLEISRNCENLPYRHLRVQTNSLQHVIKLLNIRSDYSTAGSSLPNASLSSRSLQTHRCHLTHYKPLSFMKHWCE